MSHSGSRFSVLGSLTQAATERPPHSSWFTLKANPQGAVFAGILAPAMKI
jgi:hypothetical protein